MFSYIEPVFRPPSEARSLIIQVTNGCSWNNCTFCEMYTAPQKKFSVKPQSDIESELQQVAASGYPVRRVFLADGDAMTLSFRRLREILLAIRQYLPNVQRISSYCLPRNLKNKSVEELAELQQLGLSLMYVGCESGDDLVLEKIDKGETYASSLDALHKIKQAGMKSSVMILNGLGGQQYSEQHAINSAKLMNDTQPEFLSTLVVSFPMGEERFQQGFGGEYQPLTQRQLFGEMEILLDTLQLERTVFRSDHASNYLILKGTLNRDKEQLLQQVRTAIHQPGVISLRQEWERGL
ncbi:radical SAM protein [Porticoccus litoralis]|uniref:Radical SAM protein n=1 Tax=Porticoccus litoralis TaxID=434086 RepID=A0AAW8B2Q2_9GAMM|nr:radical SAM protein [Porticoccus litoralis]MDP1519815.1 radical SAM protein [Porticoccus litoralis]